MYTAFCFDEAVSYISIKIEAKEEPRWRNRIKESSYTRPSDFYSSLNLTEGRVRRNGR